MHPFPHLLSPIRIGARTIPNRAIMGSMHLGLEEHPEGFPRMAEFYAERVRGGTPLVVTGGISPNREGRPSPHGAVLDDPSQLADHRLITEAVHAEGGLVLLQLLHFGRYASHPGLVAPSALRAPIAELTPRELDDADVRRTIEDYRRAAGLAMDAGYDGVEVMGSEGYLVNEFLAPATNRRDDAWGGDAERRRAFPLAVARAVREGMDAAVDAPAPVLSFRISLADLVPGGATAEEALDLARELEGAGVDLFVTGFGWHESRVPTIATGVPRAAFAAFAGRLREAVSVPVAASNRINTPAAAEAVLARGDADLVSLARPLLADPAFVRKAAAAQPERINTCIGCNQACIDHALSGRITSCLVNPRACHETLLVLGPVRRRKRIAVVGAGPAGLAAATALAERGHAAVLFEARDRLGGQFDLARRIPGKEEFSETLRYYGGELDRLGVETRLGAAASAAQLAEGGFDEVVVATGVAPRVPALRGVDLPLVADYARILRGEHEAGERVAILGAGGIGFDTATFLTQDLPPASLDVSRFMREWGVTDDGRIPGALVGTAAEPSARRVTMLQRKASKAGAGLGLTTGWIHRTEVRRRGVETVVGVGYEEIVPEGVVVSVGGSSRLIPADTVVLCTGQESVRGLADELDGIGIAAHVIGGARLAGELDAKRAIREGTEVAAAL
ncbi:NADPH-dependent 2,4-dienoyl-CoA reductase [Leucobacter sp. CSA1]|uniref:NADPH-dependent 2,4-dienoyl-CoA reductase n=1 Tax=Leucobacter chromiisoli TaxID=2796471 RepID=A0A934Q8K6_9MICO|nr:NADPH-dependent 2,4-dienoyl-CoA reductase [Leucobacter chromiisoli]MBK0418644.1 NADPH-dependent 2,4-dienoyl-CoA reductase [Leucobacter chromiisoli]